MRKPTNYSILVFLAGALLSFPLAAQDPYAAPDDSWISISGEVETVSPDVFTLDYGDGMITVEMDDGDRDADAYKLLKGDKVTVYGVIDDDLFETRSIEASSVYVENLNTYFFASAVDEEDMFVTFTTPIVVSELIVQGTVTNVGFDQFSIDTGTREITVETDDLAYNPLDDEGYQQISEGDVVRVTGEIEADFMMGRVVSADTVVTLRKGS
ncbi:hypothetical protein [Wenzhouxiangella sp. XN24]|uniref:hypothetical protein n=1 Tax=Wenzhouxiangella sp. XN24 TaxID=2713569 RepID=UPI0013ED08B5|nr:hypothetical protein [Wenzhouxiangella sp. XN24]NGX16471.1 hypothetical protein [Wenzhouxiangella sp. XN24]